MATPWRSNQCSPINKFTETNCIAKDFQEINVLKSTFVEDENKFIRLARKYP